MRLMSSHVYLLASRPYGTLYLGVTSNLGRRIVEHRSQKGGLKHVIPDAAQRRSGTGVRKR